MMPIPMMTHLVTFASSTRVRPSAVVMSPPIISRTHPQVLIACLNPNLLVMPTALMTMARQMWNTPMPMAQTIWRS